MSSLIKPKVLLVEDNDGDAKLISLLLRDSFPRAPAMIRAKRLAEGVALAGESEFDVALLDMGLPDSSGIQTIKDFVAARPHLPIVVLTGLDDDDVALAAIQAGAEDYLVKGTPDGKVLRRVMRYAWERRRMRTELDQTLDKLRTELAVARDMQLETIPSPEVLDWIDGEYGLAIGARFEPSAHLGGDIWGVKLADEQSLWVFLADFSGHGIAPALNTFRLHSLFAQQDLRDTSPGAFLEHLNRALCDQLPDGHFCTLICLRYGREDRRLTYASAGAPPPLVRRAGETAFVSCESRGLPIGIKSSIRYPEREIDFPPGSDLVLYSDAIIECPDREGQLLEGEKLRQWLTELRLGSPEGCVAPELARKIDQRWDLPLNDDLTMVWLARPFMANYIV